MNALKPYVAAAVSQGTSPSQEDPVLADAIAAYETWVVAFRADNPGIWMDHCHNLTHAAAGMVLHLEYRGVSTTFHHGDGTENTPE